MILTAIGIYLIGFPFLFWLIGFADKRFKSWQLNRALMAKGANKNQILKNAPEPKWPKWKERLKFTRGDKRQFVLMRPSKKKEEPKDPIQLPFTRRIAYWLFKLLGFAVAFFGGAVAQITETTGPLATGLLLSLVIYFAGIIYGYISADRLMKAREAIYKRMFSIAKTRLGQSAEYETNPQAVINVTEWADYIKPQKVEFTIPETFSEDGIESFMKLFNQNFGKENAWVAADNEETGDSGWNFDKGIATIRAVPPLPRKAPWSAHYVLGDGVAWSFFPIALGVEHGLELPNPETGETENVLGFDLSGEQAKVAQQFGLKLAPAITTSPMCLIGGGTGGGKSLAVDTMVQVFTPEELEHAGIKTARSGS